MEAQDSNDLVYKNFNLSELQALCAQINVDYEDLSGSTRKTKCLSLTQYLARRGRLLDLFRQMQRERPRVDLSPCLHELVAEQINSDEKMGRLFEDLQLTLRDFQGAEQHAWGSAAWLREKAEKLQRYFARQGQWSQLLQAVAASSDPPLTLGVLQLLFPGPRPTATVEAAEPPEVTPAAAAPEQPAVVVEPPFQDALTRGQLVLFIGADFPKAVTGLPGRAELARSLGSRHNLAVHLTLAQAAQRVSRAGNRWEFTQFLRDTLETAGKEPASFHRHVAALVQQYQLKTIITTAYDDLLEQALRQARVAHHVVINNSDVRFIQPDRLTLIKLYGAADRPESLVVTEQDHTQLLRDRDRDEVLSEVRRALAQNTVYFLGYNLSDPDFSFIYDRVAENRFARTAYAHWPGLDEAEVSMWRDRGVRILDADPLGLVGGAALPGAAPAHTDPVIPDAVGPTAKGEGRAETMPIEWLGTGNRWAVLVGVNTYDDWQNYGNLQVCVKDVNAIRQALIAGGYEPARIRVITDDGAEPPTRVNILSTLQAVALATEPGDSLLFYYSGHGDKDANTSYLIGKEGHANILADSAVSVSRVKKIMMNAAARAKVMILDACHSGAQVGKGAEPMSAEFIRRVFAEAEGLVILASCQQGERSYEWQARECSVFTHYLLEAMSGTADRDQKGFVSVGDAGKHVVNYVKLWATKQKTSQTPTLESQVSGDIILVHYQQDS